jgi:hypothetical protein
VMAGAGTAHYDDDDDDDGYSKGKVVLVFN